MSAASLPTQARSSAATPGEAGAVGRLALAESFLTSDDPLECAQAAVDWLGLRGGARRAICALIDAESGKVEQVLAFGVGRAQLGSLGIALENPDHPLVFTLAAREPVALGGPSSAAPGRNGEWRDFLAIPLPLSEKREARLGL